MNGKTTGSIVGAMFGTVCWLAVFYIGFQYIKEYVVGTLSKVCLGIAVALIITLFIDEIIDLEKIDATEEEALKDAEEKAKKHSMDKDEYVKAFGGIEMLKYDLKVQKVVDILKK